MGQGTLLFRASLGDVLRAERMRQGMTLRELSSSARVSLGYISEIERGQKEASSELLAALCEALDVPLSGVLREVSDQVADEELALEALVAPVAPGRCHGVSPGARGNCGRTGSALPPRVQNGHTALTDLFSGVHSPAGKD
jgi:DNA-binding Xre family transcriptional regulator